MKKLLIVLNDASAFLSHRLPIAQSAQLAGYEVHVATPPSPDVQKIKSIGIIHHSIPMSRSGYFPWQEVWTLWSLIKLYRQLSPNVVHHVTMKPVLYGGIAAKFCRVPGMVAAITGLGSAFIGDNYSMRWIRALMRILFGFSLRHNNSKIIFQNEDDYCTLQSWRVVNAEQAVMIKGSGVHLRDYVVQPEPSSGFTIVMAARLLKDKGVFEFVDSIRILRQRGYKIRAILAGARDEGNPSCVDASDIYKWQQENIIEVFGFVQDIASLFAQSNLVVLPSYREGLPKVLIEAAACGRAVVTTDVSGCRHAIVDQQTGLLIPARDAIALADAIELLLTSDNLRQSMGLAARQYAEANYSIYDVVQKHLDVYNALTA